ncbi:MAG: GntR family transcriptional regulator [Treponema sp.]|nr:GntR family transcriptional regulator [Candidatus Treponema equifaecale]
MKKTESSVYEILREKITNLDYKPGEELNVNTLIEELEVSRSPIRDALLRLSLDKLVDIFPQKGTRVAFLDKNIIAQERFMRINLELGVLKKFMEIQKRDNKAEIFGAELQAILLQQHASLMGGSKKSFLESDDNLHYFFYRHSDNQWIWDVINSHTGNDHRIRILSYNAKNISDNVEAEHSALVKAIREGNVEEAVKIDEAHLMQLTTVVDSLINDYPEYFSK